ncbi:AcrR family transcriptional regulator [Lipingzhangella halophila]|uniref:AcrR family transcriptional regulator n=1 Tax=Lipingzhangella halophila TaxID=1783352 RepID=A0A7W7REE1_9ACTN|nr:TetR/AcrR family transcriptional regulator [Lipingzhangella halophila]MBB4930445.1 AcrR family transcriptional regulator [Lipingzhangella halophila]
MARKVAREPGSNAWQWSRTAETRRVMLQAAREVFTERGFSESSIADVVQRANSSVGSIYHHFGGKTELFLALWEDHQNSYEEHATAAVAQARANGEEDPLELFIAGAKAFCEDTWERRDLQRLFLEGDAPPGFHVMRRARARGWVRQNAVLFGASTEAADRLQVSVLTAIIGEAAREITACEDESEVSAITDAVARMLRRLNPFQEE